MIGILAGLSALTMVQLPQSGDTADKVEEQAEERVICKVFVATGTRVRKRGKEICKTAEEWDRQAAAANEQADSLRNKPTVNIGKGN